MRIDRHIQCTFRVQRRIFSAEYRNALGKSGVIGHLPGISAGSVAQRLGIVISIGILVVTHAGTEFETQAVYRTVHDLPTITRGEHITLLIAIVTIGQPAGLAKDIVLIGQVIPATSTQRVLFRRALIV